MLVLPTYLNSMSSIQEFMIRDKTKEKVKNVLKGKVYHSIGSLKDTAKVPHYTVIKILEELQKKKELEVVMTSSGKRYRLKE